MIPEDLDRTPTGTGHTQQALGRALLDLTRSAPEAARRVVTVSPDVTSSTNLGGWLNKVGSWSAHERRDWFADDAETILHWHELPSGQHIELGIAETNLVGLLGELGATWSRWGEPLLPIGVLYDPFVARALEPWAFGMYAGGQSILVGTPSGVSLAPEGGAHQSITTPSIGLEQPGCVAFEPAFGVEVGWCLLDGLGRLGRAGGSSTYLRLSTVPVDQSLAAVPSDPAARAQRRRQVTAGAYLLRRAAGHPDGHDRGDGRAGGPGPRGRGASRGAGPADRRRRGHEPRPALPRAAGPRRGHRAPTPRRRPGSSTPRSPPTAPRAWSPSSTATRTPSRSWRRCTASAPRTSASPTSAAPPASPTPGRTTTSTPTRSWRRPSPDTPVCKPASTLALNARKSTSIMSA